MGKVGGKGKVLGIPKYKGKEHFLGVRNLARILELPELVNALEHQFNETEISFEYFI